jgi:hypothetical protein
MLKKWSGIRVPPKSGGFSEADAKALRKRLQNDYAMKTLS